MQNRIFAALVVVLGWLGAASTVLTPTAAYAQQFPQTMPGNTVYGRLGGSTAGPGQAIPLTRLFAQIPATGAEDVTRYGAACDGVTNDTARIQTRLDLGGLVILPANKTCLVTALT